MAEKNNALAELAKDLEEIVRDTKSDFYTTRIGKASRIVAELAKVEYLTCDGTVISTVLTQADKAVISCREIAEEGADNGK